MWFYLQQWEPETGHCCKGISSVLKVLICVKRFLLSFSFQMGDRQDPSSNHDQVGAALGVPKTHLHSIGLSDWRKGHAILIGGKTVHPHQNLTGDKTEVQTWTKHSIAKTHFVII